MNLENERIKNPLMEYYRYVYHFSNKWNGKDSLEGRKVVVYCEQGFGDIIQMMRYIPALKSQGCHVTLHVPEVLHPVLECLDVDLLEKNNPRLPEHDFHILSLSLPFLLNIPVSSEPYLKYDKVADLGEEGEKIGIAWEGSPEHPKNIDRCCPLKNFKLLLKQDTKLYMLQNKVNLPEFCEDVDFDIYGIEIKDFGDTASLINAVDCVVTVDTSILHLAGAMGKRTYALINKNDPDPRWNVANWYNSVTLIQSDWTTAFAILSTRK